MNNERPVNLDLATIKQPITAISSILHRISGIVLFLALPVLLWFFDKSLQSATGFEEAKACVSGGLGSFFIWATLSALSYHIIAGLRHLLMDMGWGETLQGGKASAAIVLVVSGVMFICWGIWVW